MCRFSRDGRFQLAQATRIFACFCVQLVAIGLMHAEDKTLAEIGDRRVTYREVSCNREVAATRPDWLRGRSVEEACAGAERAQFRVVAAKILVEKICALEGYEPSEQELEGFRSPILKDEALLHRVVRDGRTVPEAVRRVYRGERIETVYEEVRRVANISFDAFSREVAMFRSLEVVERFLAKDALAEARRQYEQKARDRAMRAELRKRVAALAEVQKQTVDTAAEDYLHSMIVRIGVSVHDPQFELPTGKEVIE
jgi:hypothetical protein